MKAFLFTLLRVLLIISVGSLGLAGLALSACGGLMLFGGSGANGMAGLVVAGLACIAIAAGLILWIVKASNRVVLILFLLLCLPLLLRLAFRLLGH